MHRIEDERTCEEYTCRVEIVAAMSANTQIDQLAYEKRICRGHGIEPSLHRAVYGPIKPGGMNLADPPIVLS
jgi:hypothetical protein